MSTDTLAHSFKVGLVAPMSGADSNVGRQGRDGFRLATTERDGHSNEESDGHLGGLDVYILVIDANQSAGAVLLEIERLVEREQVEILASLAPTNLEQDIRRRLAATNTVLITALEAAPQDATTMDGEPFDSAFEGLFGYAPLRLAYQGYGLARQIDRAVRAIEGDFSDPDVVRSAIQRASRQ